jgi:hypothetical protein
MNETQKKVKELFKKLLRAEKQDFPGGVVKSEGALKLMSCAYWCRVGFDLPRY